MLKQILGILISLSLLSGCGQMGPLYLPAPDHNAKHTSGE